MLSLGGTALVSTNFVTAKSGLAGFDPETFSLVWTASGAAFSLAIALAACGPARLVPPPRDLGLLLALGLSTAAGMLLSWAGLETLDPSFQAFLFRFMPVVTVILGAVVLRERFLAAEVFPLALMVAGGLASSFGKFDVVGRGVALTMASCVCFAVQMILAKVLVSRGSAPAVVAFHRLFFGAVLVAAWVLPSGRADFSVGARYWAVTVVGAFLGPCLAHVLIFRSYRHWDLNKTALVSATQPLFVIPLAMLFLARSPAPAELAGGAVLLTGALWFSWIEMRAGSTVREPPACP